MGLIQSGALDFHYLASGCIISGDIASGQIGSFHHASGSLTGFELGSGSIVSGRIASGQVGATHIASGGILSGAIASGSVGKNHTASGLLQASLQFIIDGGGTAIASGDKGDIIIPYNCKLTNLNLFSDQSGGSVFVGIWKNTYANYPCTSGNSISVSGVPLISGAIKNTYSGTASLSGWTTSFTKDDILKFVVHSGGMMTRVTVSMQVGIGD